MTAIDQPNAKILTYQDLLDTDTHEVPEVLRRQSILDEGPLFIPTSRYTSAAVHQQEMEQLWSRVWQMACREEHLPNPGDHVVYDVGDLSILVVRAEDGEITAYRNVCLHRGRRLKDGDGNSPDLRCSFHGFCWNLDGTIKQVPCPWDFPHIDEDEYQLLPVGVGQWGGFVFVNPDPEAEPFESFLGDLPSHFERWPLEDRFVQAHVAKIVRANWKVVQEAFMEAFHVVATHPQLLPGIGDANSQYDAWGSYSRAITANATPSPHLRWEPSEQDMFDAVLDRDLDQPPVFEVPPDTTARAVLGELGRERLREFLGDAVDELSDAEMNDSFYYTLFPNLHPWGAYNRICYRFRPYGDDHNRSIMECMFLAPFNGERPPPAPIHWLGEDEPWTDAPELALLARVFEQDMFNLPHVHRGLKSGSLARVTLAAYQETKIRHWHKLYEDFIA